MSAPGRPTREAVERALKMLDGSVLATEVRALRAVEQAARAFVASEDRGPFESAVAVRDLRAALAARTPQPGEPSTGDLLRAAAAGRREYAGPECEGGSGNAKVDEMREVLLTQAATLDGAAKVADGDMGPLYGWLPSWRWTAEMDRRVLAGTSDSTTRADAAALAPAAPLPAVPDGEDADDLRARWLAYVAEHGIGPGPVLAPPTLDGEDVPARLDAAADALAAADLARGAAALRDAASVASIAGPDVRAAVAAALARPTEPQR